MFTHPKIPEANSLYLKCQDFVDLERDLRSTRAKFDSNVRLAVDPQVNFKKQKNSCLSKHVFGNMHIQSLAMMTGWDVMQIYQSPRPYKEYKLFNQLTRGGVFKDHEKLLNSGISHVLRENKLEENSELLDFYKYLGPIGPLFLYQVKDYKAGLTNLGCLKIGEDDKLKFVSEFGERSVIRSLRYLERHPEVECNEQTSDQPSVQLIEQKGSSLEYQLDQPQAGILISDQVFGGAWKGYLGKEALKPIKVDDYRLGFLIPAGSHTFKMSYQPRTLIVGAALTYSGLMILLLCLLWPFIEPRVQRILNRGQVAST